MEVDSQAAAHIVPVRPAKENLVLEYELRPCNGRFRDGKVMGDYEGKSLHQCMERETQSDSDGGAYIRAVMRLLFIHLLLYWLAVTGIRQGGPVVAWMFLEWVLKLDARLD